VARAATRQISFADVELMRQGVRLEPVLEVISSFLDCQHELIERVRRDLVRGLKKPRKGRRGLTAPQVLRSLVLMRLKNWDYRELRERIADGLTLRQFTDFYCDPVPKHDAFNRGFNRLTPATLKAVNDLVVQAAVALGLEDGARLRVDTTVVETDIHHPTDNTLLWDVVRVVTRLIGRLAEALNMRRIEGFCDRRRAAHRRMYEIQRMTTRQRQGAGSRQTATYRALIGIARGGSGERQGRTRGDRRDVRQGPVCRHDDRRPARRDRALLRSRRACDRPRRRAASSTASRSPMPRRSIRSSSPIPT
jgi:IS5 family transposase